MISRLLQVIGFDPNVQQPNNIKIIIDSQSHNHIFIVKYEPDEAVDDSFE